MRTRSGLAAALVAALIPSACADQSPAAPQASQASTGEPAPARESAASPSTPTVTPEPGPYTQPAFVEPPIDGPDRPGDDLIDWRRQVRESVQRHPGTFAVPVELPADIHLAFTSTWWEHPVLDVMSDGSGVIVCRNELPACEAALGDAPVTVVRSGEVDSDPFHVLLKPPAEPGTTGELTPAQQDYWATVALTSAVPDWAMEAARAGAPREGA
ncbi:hypothetical protein [Kineococcus sp. SYSU DK018]|uniref:hypothetical protein n=1 Tax=Kineococcus sp. SYSU DK018 TaxID=3383139 RepID=UPI003D7D9A10